MSGGIVQFRRQWGRQLGLLTSPLGRATPRGSGQLVLPTSHGQEGHLTAVPSRCGIRTQSKARFEQGAQRLKTGRRGVKILGFPSRNLCMKAEEGVSLPLKQEVWSLQLKALPVGDRQISTATLEISVEKSSKSENKSIIYPAVSLLGM